MPDMIVTDDSPTLWSFRIDIEEAGDTKGVLTVESYAHVGATKYTVISQDPDFAIPPVDDYWTDFGGAIVAQAWLDQGFTLP